MKLRCLTTLALLCFGAALPAFSQTTGTGEVTAIEAKAQQINANKTAIAKAKTDLAGAEEAWKKRVQALRDELSALYKEQDNLIGDMKIGAKCSQCGKYKSQFEKEGVNFQKHLGEVKGYAIPATTAELEAVREKFKEKIAYKKVQLQNAEKGDPALITRRKAVTDLEAKQTSLCKEITQHSKNYDTKLEQEARAKHQAWTGELMPYLSAILVAEDKGAIYKERIARYEKAFQQEAEKLRQAIKEKTEQEQQEKNDRIADHNNTIQTLKNEQEEYAQTIGAQLAPLQAQKSKNAAALKKPLADSLKTELLAEQVSLQTRITDLTKTLDAYNAATNSKIAALEKEAQKLKTEVWQLTVDLGKRQELEVQKIKPGYDKQKAEATKAVATAAADLVAARAQYTERTGFYNKKNDLFAALVTSEANRMVTAGAGVECPVYNNVRGMVVSHWREEFQCLNRIASMAKPYGTNVFNAYCKEQSSPQFLSGYKSFLRSLDADDARVVQGNSNVGWYETMAR